MPDYRILILTGCSGSGKTTLMNELVDQREFGIIRSATTRMQRSDDSPIDYEYLSFGEFKSIAGHNGFVNVRCIDDHYYGCRLQALNEARCDSGRCYARSITPKDVEAWYNAIGDEGCFIHLATPDESEIRSRLKLRGMNDVQISSRFSNERSWEDQIDYLIKNGYPINRLPLGTIFETLERIIHIMNL